MVTEVERLAVLFEANTKQFANAVRKIERQTDGAFKKATRSSRKFDSALARNARTAQTLAAAFGVGFVAGGLSQIPSALRAIVGETARIGEVADKVGLATDELQRFRFAAEQTGVASGQADIAVQRFSRRIAEAAAGGGVLEPVLKANNIALRDQNGQIRPALDLLKDYADLIKNSASNQDQLRLAFLAFDTEGAALVNTLRNGSDGLSEFFRVADQSGGVIDDKLVRSMQRFDAILKQVSRTAEVNFKSGVVTSIDAVTDAVGSLEKRLGELGNSGFFQRLAAALGADPAEVERIENELNNRTGGLSFGPPRRDGQRRKAPPTKIPGNDNDTDANRSVEQKQRVIDMLRFEVEQLGRAAQAQELYNRLNQAGVDINSKAGQEISRLVGQIHEQESAALRAAEAADFLGNATLQAFEGIVLNGEKASDVIADLVKQLALAAAQSALLGSGPLANLFGTADSGGLFGVAFGGARAAGGPVSAGRAYMVGEQGPELFRPGQAGRIISNRDMRAGSGGATVINQSFSSGLNRIDRAWVQTQVQIGMREAVAVNDRRMRAMQASRSDAVLQR